MKQEELNDETSWEVYYKVWKEMLNKKNNNNDRDIP